MAFPLTLAKFRNDYPEFTSTPDTLVQAKLDAAERRTPEDVWGTKASDGQGLLAAHLLQGGNYGGDTRVDNKNPGGQTTYGAQRDRMERELGTAHAPRVT